jgi:hypothetical protein
MENPSFRPKSYFSGRALAPGCSPISGGPTNAVSLGKRRIMETHIFHHAKYIVFKKIL